MARPSLLQERVLHHSTQTMALCARNKPWNTTSPCDYSCLSWAVFYQTNQVKTWVEPITIQGKTEVHLESVMPSARGHKLATWSGGPDLHVFHYYCTDTSHSTHIYGVGGGKRLSSFHWWAGLMYGCKQKRDFCCRSWSETNNCYLVSPFLSTYFIFFHSRLNPLMSLVLQLHLFLLNSSPDTLSVGPQGTLESKFLPKNCFSGNLT